MIFNTSPNAHCPIYVVEASLLCGSPANNDIPICLAYNQTHYEALVPDSFEEVGKIIALKKNFLNGSYQKTMNDIPFLNHQGSTTQKQSYADVLKGETFRKKEMARRPLKNEIHRVKLLKLIQKEREETHMRISL